MSEVSFNKFLCLLSQKWWAQKDIDQIESALKKKPEFLSTRLGESLCAECNRENMDRRRCERCQEVVLHIVLSIS